MKLEDLEIYNLSMDFSDIVWKLVDKLEYFSKSTIGSQWVRAVDSISANISEGFGRNTYKVRAAFILLPEVRCTKARHGCLNRSEEI